ncbi:LacI family DNA-binding transcriptional regulator [Tritonibacter scottomollicae]|uniref:LacI family DNA-binding transcriptional regulator n=1 Tax=Tritonibacter scottomollicae TaxID=483013 RepID=UPI003AA89DB5
MESDKIRNMDEFATVAGISRPTISKYFHDPESVKKSTRARIEDALERYDYRPNIFAMNQNRRSTKNIGILVPYLADPFFAEIARTIERRCIDAGFWPIMLSSHGEQRLENDALDGLRGLRVAGALLAPLGRRSDKRALEQFCHAVPSVLFDSEVEDMGEAFVGMDNSKSIPLIVDYLCRTGEAPAFFEMPPVNPNANKRREAYIGAMERLGHEPQIVHVSGDNWNFEEIGYSEGLKVLASGQLKTNTVLCSNDRLAIGLLAAAYERGLRVGRGTGCALRIAGHDDHPFSRFTCPPLTTVAQDFAQIAERSVDTLFRVLESGGSLSARETSRLDGKLVMRESA